MASAHWLASSIESFGAEPNLIGFDMARVIFKHRARYVSVLSPNALLRHQADRWPEAVDIGRTEPIGQAIAQMCISAAN